MRDRQQGRMRPCLEPHMCGSTGRCMHRPAIWRMRQMDQHHHYIYINQPTPNEIAAGACSPG